MKKIITIIISIIIILSTSLTWATTAQQYKELQRNNLITLCENAYAEEGVYECILLEFYGLNKVVDLLIETRDPEDRKVLFEFMLGHVIPEYQTYDFMAIHLDFMDYLENRIKGEGYERDYLFNRADFGR